jgi:hypothetical protein
MGWAHQGYGEFLASLYLFKRGVPAATMLKALRHPTGGLIPQLSGVAALPTWQREWPKASSTLFFLLPRKSKHNCWPSRWRTSDTCSSKRQGLLKGVQVHRTDAPVLFHAEPVQKNAGRCPA